VAPTWRRIHRKDKTALRALIRKSWGRGLGGPRPQHQNPLQGIRA